MIIWRRKRSKRKRRRRERKENLEDDMERLDNKREEQKK